MTAHCQAADIRFIPPSTSTAQTIVITGTFESGDFAKFSTYADKISAGSKVVITLDSNGGRLAEGLDIGTAIANRGFATIANHKCLSACALTWLAGARRAVYPNTHIGFHAAYRSYDKQESGAANALVGSYLTKLGFSVDAIVYMTKAAPASMEWLTKEKAQQYGIKFDYLNANGEFAQMADKKSESKPVPHHHLRSSIRSRCASLRLATSTDRSDHRAAAAVYGRAFVSMIAIAAFYRQQRRQSCRNP